MLNRPLRWCLAGLLLMLLQACSTMDMPLDLTSPVKRRAAADSETLEATAAKAHARWTLPFARVSSAVRCRDLDATDVEKAEGEGCSTLTPLRDTGWVKLYDEAGVLDKDEAASGLRFAAFARQRPDQDRGEILIGFRGTRFNKLSDWRANLRWVTQFMPLPGRDHYQVVRRHSQQLVTLAEEQARLKLPGVLTFDTYTTGHSLGGGLAQLLAYSDHRVTAAVVFDPSPVTGYNNLVKSDAVNCSARVARIYERGEGLSYIRTALRYFYALSDNIEEVSYDFLHTGGNPLANHSMTDLLRGLEARAEVQPGERVRINNSELPENADCDCYRMRKPKPVPGLLREEQDRQACENRDLPAPELPPWGDG